MCGCECCISSKSMHSSLLLWREHFWKNLKIKVVMPQKGDLIKWPIFYSRHKNSVITHGKYMFQKASNMAISRMCAYKYSNHELPHWECVLRCCAQCPNIDLKCPESDQHN